MFQTLKNKKMTDGLIFYQKTLNAKSATKLRCDAHKTITCNKCKVFFKLIKMLCQILSSMSSLKELKMPIILNSLKHSIQNLSQS